MLKASIVAAIPFVGLSACLDSDLEHRLAGATAGAIVADNTGVNPLAGAVVGGVAGACINNGCN